MRFIALFLILIVPLSGYNQDFIRAFDIPVIEEAQALRNAWAGGLNFVQYSTIDLNFDDVDDLFLFDRAGEKVLTFISTLDDQNEYYYSYDPSYESIFPEGLRHWVVLRDYNCDGLKDIFTHRFAGIAVYEQVVSGDQIDFELTYSPISCHYGYEDPYDAPIYNVFNDLPAITDMDNDGDIDILSFSPTARTIHYYINNASDIGRCDTLIMELANACYGFVSESQTNDAISIGVNCQENVVNVRSQGSSVHLGGTLSSFDTNGDGLNELFIGDSTSERMMMLTNGESSQGLDSMIVNEGNFPANISATPGIAFYQFPGIYNEDFNNDEVLDLASSSFHAFGAQDDESSWLYYNEGTNDAPEYVLQTNSWLQEEMIEHGTNSYPILADYDGDGLQDLIVGNKYTVLNNDLTHSNLRLYRNTGSVSAPQFELEDEDWLELSLRDYRDMYPAFGDMDGDLDLDFVFGEASGKLNYLENQSGAVGVFDYPEDPVFLQYNGDDLDIGQNAKLQLIDLDEDGLLDLVIGELAGNLNYYRNIGSETDPEFSLESENLGGVVIDDDEFEANSIPFFYKDAADSWNLVVGSKNGHLQRYSGISNNLLGTYTRIDQSLFSDIAGEFSAPCAYDINNDGYHDLFIGNIRGGISFYTGQFFDGITEQEARSSLNIYPNPTSGIIQLDLSSVKGVPSPGNLFVFNSIGQKIEVEMTWVTNKSVQIDFRSFSKGIYMLSYQSGLENYVSRVVIKD